MPFQVTIRATNCLPVLGVEPKSSAFLDECVTYWDTVANVVMESQILKRRFQMLEHQGVLQKMVYKVLRLETHLLLDAFLVLLYPFHTTVITHGNLHLVKRPCPWITD